MTVMQGTYELEYALVWIFDASRTSDYVDYDPAEHPVFAFGTVLVIAAQHEVDGPVRLRLAIDDDAVSLDASSVELGKGQLDIPTGELAIAVTAGFEPVETAQVLPGTFEYRVYGDTPDSPAVVTVVLTRA